MKKNISIAAILTVIMVIVMRWQGNALVNTISPGGIINLEFADTPQDCWNCFPIGILQL